MSVAITDFIPAVQLEVSNCPRVVMIDAVRQVLIDFCTRSRFWRYECDALVTVYGVREYELDIPVQTECVSIRTLSFDARPLTEKSIDWLDENEPNWRTMTGRPSYYGLRDPNTILLDRAPGADYEITATVALQPSETALTCGDILFERCRDAIANGAISRLKGMTDKPWSDENGEAKKRGLYEMKLSEFKSIAQKGYGTRGKIRARGSFL